MKPLLAALIITKNNEETIKKTLESVKNFDEIVVVDSNSTDKTRDVVHKVLKVHKVYKVFLKSFEDIGKQRAYGLKYVSSEWVLILDSDEVAPGKLIKEIKYRINDKSNNSAYEIPFQSYFLDRQLNFGGEDYCQLRLIKKDCVDILPSIVHNRFRIKKGKMAKLKEKIHHYSYRSLSQVYKKFTDYALKTAEIKAKKGERSSLKKIFLYPLHIFYARFIKDKGYKDGLFRIPLDTGFAYMEFLTYLLLAILSLGFALRMTEVKK